MQSSLSSLSTRDISTHGRVLLAIPIGSCEQHGPHLPLDTDTRIAMALCLGLAEASGRVLIAPAITIGASGEHDGFAGTLSIGTAALTSVLVEIVRSAHWATGVVLVNGHGGNAQAVAAAVENLRGEQRRVTAWWPPSNDLDGECDFDSHAGNTETSLMLAIAPHSVRMDLAEVGVVAPLTTIIDKLRLSGVASVSANGILGDPRSASAAHGHKLLSHFIKSLVDHVEKESGTWTP
ncbi:MAG: mycofactocin biosynthesis peptidyl-dipeptidase MftE [Ilumatobacteraceae bacterium]